MTSVFFERSYNVGDVVYLRDSSTEIGIVQSKDLLGVAISSSLAFYPQFTESVGIRCQGGPS